MVQICKKAKLASKFLSNMDEKSRNEILINIARNIEKNGKFIIEENKKDIQNAIKNNLAKPIIQRLTIDNKIIQSIIDGVLQISKLKSPVGKILDSWINEDGLKIDKVSTPIGVICVIFESRPNVLSDIVALCIKSANVCILKGGKEANYSISAIAKCIYNALDELNVDKNIVNILENCGREDVKKILKMDKFIDVVIPRGGESLIKFVSKYSKIPVIKHDKGICHIFVDSSANIDKSISVCINAKCQKPSVCNAIETILVHKDVANEFILKFYKKGIEFNLEIYGCKYTKSILKKQNVIIKKPQFNREFLDFIVNIKVVNNIDEAIKHITKYSSSHSEAILSNNIDNIDKFLNNIDSTCLYSNASTRFSDGFIFGFGAEIGISTNKLHARGPVGLNELTTYKYKIYGNYDIRKR